MNLTFIYLAPFEARRKKLGLTDEDLEALEKEILANPQAGKVMSGTGGVRKIRFAPPSWHTGKSGAARVVYFLYSAGDAVYVITVFAKNEKDNLSDADKAICRSIAERLKKG